MNLRRLGAIVLKELRQLRRDKLTFAMIAGIPLLELVLFGYAINMDVRGIEAAVLDQTNTAQSREAVAEIASSQVINIQYHLHDPQQIDQLLRQGKISAALVVPRDFEARLQRQDRPPLQLVVDGSDQSVQASARQLAAYPLPGWDSRQGVEVVNFYNPERLAPLNTVPGLLGVILTMTMVLFTAVALVREREHGNLELLIATPVSPWELTIGKVLPFIGIGLIQVTVILVVGHWLFGVPVRGAILDLYGASLLFIVASLALTALLGACTTATPYQPNISGQKVQGGYSEQQVEPDRFRVTFSGNSLTSRETVEGYLLYRAAELTVQQGYDWFEIVERDETWVAGLPVRSPKRALGELRDRDLEAAWASVLHQDLGGPLASAYTD